MVSVMLIEHAGGAYCSRALFAKVFNAFRRVSVAWDHLSNRLASLGLKTQKRKQLKICLESFRSADVVDFSSANRAAPVLPVVNHIIDTIRANSVCAIWKDGWHPDFVIEALVAAIADNKNSKVILQSVLLEAFLHRSMEVGDWLSDCVHF